MLDSLQGEEKETKEEEGTQFKAVPLSAEGVTERKDCRAEEKVSRRQRDNSGHES